MVFMEGEAGPGLVGTRLLTKSDLVASSADPEMHVETLEEMPALGAGATDRLQNRRSRCQER